MVGFCSGFDKIDSPASGCMILLACTMGFVCSSLRKRCECLHFEKVVNSPVVL